MYPASLQTLTPLGQQRIPQQQQNSSPIIYGDYINLPEKQKNNAKKICTELSAILGNPECVYSTINTQKGILDINPTGLQMESDITAICTKLRSVSNYHGCYVDFKKNDQGEQIGQLIVMMRLFEKKSDVTFSELKMRETAQFKIDPDFLRDLHDIEYCTALEELVRRIETYIVPDVTDAPYKLNVRAMIDGFNVRFDNTDITTTNKIDKLVKLLGRWSIARNGLVSTCKFTNVKVYQDNRGFRFHFFDPSKSNETKKRKRQESNDDDDEYAPKRKKFGDGGGM